MFLDNHQRNNLLEGLIEHHEFTNAHFNLIYTNPNNPSFYVRVTSNTFDIKGKSLEISDFLVSDLYIGKGYGKLAMTKYLKLCKAQGFFYISGKITSKDWNFNIERLVYLYRNLGFEVTLDRKTKTGTIYQDLNKPSLGTQFTNAINNIRDYVFNPSRLL